jgi:putative flippase GtrA
VSHAPEIRQDKGIVRAEPRIRQFFKFVAVGLLATAIQYGVLLAAVELFGLPATMGSGIGFVLSAAANYYLNHRLTFRSERQHLSAASRFVVVSAVGLLLNVAVMQLLTVHWRIQYVLAQVVATALIVSWSLCGNAYWTFADRAER